VTDCGFPIIEYDVSQSPRERGRMHGERFRAAIAELVEIRRGLMREKNPTLSHAMISELAEQQWEATRLYDLHLSEELQGICDGSGLSRESITVLNNYTDFRDIKLVDQQGCSVVYINYGSPLAGQTWDMHGSAKNYVAIITIPARDGRLEAVVFSLVGCVGMMGFTRQGTTVQVNNINTDGAIASVMWPAIVRKILRYSRHDEMSEQLATAAASSGHSYLLASRERAEMWEVMPGLAERVDFMQGGQRGYLFHTNHCLGRQAVLRETQIAQNSTTYIRFELLKRKLDSVKNYEALYALLNDHENYPKSICSNFQTDSQDPSITCGGAIGDLNTGRVQMWRGDELYDKNFVLHDFQF
jgi:isopenicillin-N N-acyltransferase-like protein